MITMQALLKKYSHFYIFLYCFLNAFFVRAANIKELKQADSLFAIARYDAAKVLYEKNFGEDKKNNQALLLKLAFLSEKSNNYTNCLFYLSKLALQNPSGRLFEKMDKIASEQNLKGYDFDDYNYFIIFYRRYGDYIPLLLLGLGAYIVFIMASKIRKREGILMIHKISILVYLIALFGILNLPSLYKTAIIINQNTFLRNEPSSAAGVVEKVGKGHRITVVGSVDTWNRIIWNNKLVYVRKVDLKNI